MLMLMVMLLVWRPRTTALKEEKKKPIKEILPEGVTFFLVAAFYCPDVQCLDVPLEAFLGSSPTRF